MCVNFKYLKKNTNSDKNDPNIDRFKCDECGMTFYRIDVFKNHMRIHNGKNSRRNAAEYSFQAISSYFQTMRI